jgi:hypothetical protein
MRQIVLNGHALSPGGARVRRSDAMGSSPVTMPKSPATEPCRSTRAPTSPKFFPANPPRNPTATKRTPSTSTRPCLTTSSRSSDGCRLWHQQATPPPKTPPCPSRVSDAVRIPERLLGAVQCAGRRGLHRARQGRCGPIECLLDQRAKTAGQAIVGQRSPSASPRLSRTGPRRPTATCSARHSVTRDPPGTPNPV